MVTKIMEWVCNTALLLAVTWRPFASYQMPLDFVVCAGPLMGVLALFFIEHEMETHFDVDNRSNPAEASRCKTVSVTVPSAPANAVERRALFCRNPCDSKASPGPLSVRLVKLFENCG